MRDPDLIAAFERLTGRTWQDTPTPPLTTAQQAAEDHQHARAEDETYPYSLSASEAQHASQVAENNALRAADSALEWAERGAR